MTTRATSALYGLILCLILQLSLAQLPSEPLMFIYGLNGYNSSLPNIVNAIVNKHVAKPTLVTHNSSISTFQLPGKISFVSAQIHSVAVVLDETKLYTWGMEALAGRGTGSWTYDTPRLVADFAPAKVVSLKSADTFSTILLNNHTVYSWGSGDRKTYVSADYGSTFTVLGQLGQPLNSVSLGNVLFPKDAQITSLYDNTDSLTHAIGIDGVVWSWGSDRTGSTGTGADAYFPTPVPNIEIVKPAGTKVVLISASMHVLALLDDGSYVCWGAYGYNNCGNGVLAVGIPVTQPIHVESPLGIGFTKIITGYDATWAMANDSTLWGWGSIAYNLLPYPNQLSCTLYDAETMCFRQQLPTDEYFGAKVIDIYSGFITFFALTEKMEIWQVGMKIETDLSYSSDWMLIDWQLPPGHSIDFDRSQCSSTYMLWVTKPVTSCSSSPPSIGSIKWICVNGIWTSFESVNIQDPIILDTPIDIRGNLTLSTGAQITVKSGALGDRPLISITGCVQNAEQLKLLLELTKQDLEGTSTKTRVLLEASNGCEPITASLKVSQPKSCKKVSASSSSSPSSADTSKTHLSAILKIDSSKCNTWWYILVAVLGAVIIIGVILGLLLNFNPKLRAKCRPFARPAH
jgi:alpha-tubulin suppressor-like RCC1 family protein